MVDVYCKFTDKFYGTSQPSAPKEAQTPAEETTSEKSDVQDAKDKSESEESAPPTEGSASVPEEQIDVSEITEQTSDELDIDQEPQADEEASNRPQTGL